MAVNNDSIPFFRRGRLALGVASITGIAVGLIFGGGYLLGMHRLNPLKFGARAFGTGVALLSTGSLALISVIALTFLNRNRLSELINHEATNEQLDQLDDDAALAAIRLENEELVSLGKEATVEERVTICIIRTNNCCRFQRWVNEPDFNPNLTVKLGENSYRLLTACLAYRRDEHVKLLVNHRDFDPDSITTSDLHDALNHAPGALQSLLEKCTNIQEADLWPLAVQAFKQNIQEEGALALLVERLAGFECRIEEPNEGGDDRRGQFGFQGHQPETIHRDLNRAVHLLSLWLYAKNKKQRDLTALFAGWLPGGEPTLNQFEQFVRPPVFNSLSSFIERNEELAPAHVRTCCSIVHNILLNL